jgi:hypothetical protein
MQTVYIVFEMYTDGEEFIKQVCSVFSTRKEADVYVFEQKTLSLNFASIFEIEPWEVQ